MNDVSVFFHLSLGRLYEIFSLPGTTIIHRLLALTHPKSSTATFAVTYNGIIGFLSSLTITFSDQSFMNVNIFLVIFCIDKINTKCAVESRKNLKR